MMHLPPAGLDRRRFLRVRPARPASRPPGDLRPFTPTAADPWDAVKARHLLRRIAPDPRPDDVAALLTLAPGEAVAQIVAAARDRPDLPSPSWIGLRHPGSGATPAERDAFDDANKQAFWETLQGIQNRLLGGDGDRLDRLGMVLRERMTMLWADHYVTEYRSHNTATWAFEYLQILHAHALGAVPDLVHAVGTTPAMLRYLNGDQNRVGAPNENYARELLELFTMGTSGPGGAATYTQADVSELARALTGWRTDKRRPDHAYFQASRFDGGDKTVFGQTGAWGYDDVTPLLFEQRAPQIAHFLAGVLYRAFVSDEPDAGVVAALADRLQSDGFEIAPAVEALLQSAHFFDPAHVGALVKSPVDLVLGAASLFGLRAVDLDASRNLRWQMSVVGQELLNPPDVSGWPGGTAWIDTSTFPERVRRSEALVQRSREAIADEAAARPSAWVARDLAANLAADLLTHPPDEATLDAFTDILLSGTPSYSWDPTSTGGRTRVRDYVKHLVSLPEYQLR